MRATLFSVALLLLSAGALADERRGAELLLPFKQQLQKALLEGLEQGSAAAVTVCNIRAPRLAAEASSQGIRLGRSSHRLRNPSNKAPGWVQPIMDAYADASPPWQPATVRIGQGREGYVEPIEVKPLCLNCHGSQLAPDVKQRIRALYPSDQATGYAVGDLRGVFWIEYPVAGSTKE